MTDTTNDVVLESTPDSEGNSASVEFDATEKKRAALQRKEELKRKQAEAIQSKKGEAETEPLTAGSSTPSPSTSNSNTPTKPAPKPKVLRKDQIENAVRFLTHPKVKESPLGKRIAFLEHKGLNDDEISAALKQANVSAEDIKAAQQAQSSDDDSSTYQDRGTEIASQRGPQLPARPPVSLPVQPAIPQSQWKSQALTALLCFGFGTATTFLAGKYLLAPGGPFAQKGGAEAADSKKKKKKKSKKKKAMKSEINDLRANQEALNKEMKDAVSSMQALLELQTKGGLAARSPSVLARSSPVSSDSKGEEIESLKAELKALRARMLDQQSSTSNIAKSVASGRTEKPLVTIPPATITAEGSALPSWMINSTPLKKSSTTATTTSPTPASPSQSPPSSPDAPVSVLDTNTLTHDSESTVDETEQTQTVVTPTSTTNTTTTTTTTAPSTDQGTVKRERPPKPYQLKGQKPPATQGRAPSLHRGVVANGDAMEENQVGSVDRHHNINENEAEENDGEAAENENVKMQHAADNLEENRAV